MFSIAAKVIAAIAACSIQANANALPYALESPRDDYTNIAVRAVDVVRDLGPQLSENAVILTPEDPEFRNATNRFSYYMSPTFSVVVEPGSEEDVSTIVTYANKVNIPFLPVNQAHGRPDTLGRIRNGLQISMNVLDDITIVEDNESVRVQAGAYTDSIVPALWNAGYETTTGSCGCVGVLGAGLGGGFGPLMGQYGLVSDSFLSFNVVLGNGSAITVSREENGDLFWAMRGAGHNFGIVTSFTKQIHPIAHDSWYYASHLFTQDKLEALYELTNQQNDLGRQAEGLTTLLDFVWSPELSPNEPVIRSTLIYAGTQSAAAQYSSPYEAIGPIPSSSSSGNTPYPGLRAAIGLDSAGPACDLEIARTNRKLLYPIGLLKYDIPTQRRVFDLFSNVTISRPEYRNSSIITETYAVAGMKRQIAVDSAYPHREDNLLVTLRPTYGPDPSLDEFAFEWAAQTRRLWEEGQPGRKTNVYVNYAIGTESNEQVYGYDEWRLERLRAAKKKYDPLGKFNYYMPIEI